MEIQTGTEAIKKEEHQFVLFVVQRSFGIFDSSRYIFNIWNCFLQSLVFPDRGTRTAWTSIAFCIPQHSSHSKAELEQRAPFQGHHVPYMYIQAQGAEEVPLHYFALSCELPHPVSLGLLPPTPGAQGSYPCYLSTHCQSTHLNILVVHLYPT